MDSGYLSRMQTALKKYEATVADLRNAHVLDQNFDSLDKDAVFASRREVVQRFLKANGAIKEAITNAEGSIRADLVKAQVSDTQIEAVMTGYHSSAAPMNVVTLKIRECDDTMGNAMLDALNTLEDEPRTLEIPTPTKRPDPVFNDRRHAAQRLQQIHERL